MISPPPRSTLFPYTTLFRSYQEKGEVDVVSGQVNRSTGSISLRASFPNSTEVMRSGNTGTIRLKESKAGVILVPQEAVINIQDRTFVYTIDEDNKARLTPIKLDGVSESYYIISSGLKPGDAVILTGFHKIEEGVLIKAKEEK